ncbi:hypothetical protein ET475_07010 [Microbacterium protaetiae]|uniref:WXG100 family type VII secretion target n=1 Tax=Microbacterium protaetiae TaxID=2509458 RepID=A0A4P6EC12_9MICO|nr:hypothetical protein [Microbacterium protaetiae]QAY59762.1 hypothetical protein ET475_07010 [Microbacterium protaetiae]
MTGNPLVAAAVDHTSPFAGTLLVEDGEQLVQAVNSGDWVSGGMAAFSGLLDTAAAVSDPLGSLIAAGLGWLIDHVEPLKGWFNDLTGNAAEVQAFAQTWANIHTQMEAAGTELHRVLGDVDDLAGQAIDAYRRFQQDTAKHLTAAGTWAGAFSTGLNIASMIVQAVHDLVRDVLSQLVGSAISWASEAVFTLGLATPWIIEQVSTRVASWVSKVGKFITRLLESLKSLRGLLDELKPLLDKASELFGKLLHGGSGTHAPSAHSPRVGDPLTDVDFHDMGASGYHSSIFGDQVLQFYDTPNAHLGAPDSSVWAMPTEDAARIHTPADAARQTGMAPMAQNAYLNGGDLYAIHFPVDPTTLRRPTVADADGWAHFYADPTSRDPIYGHTAVNTGADAYLINPTRETLVPGETLCAQAPS